MAELRGSLGFKGERGYSAYEIAVQNGYEGTEEEWIEHFGLDLTDYIKNTDIIDNLTSESTTRPLSANQGKVLKDLIDTPISEIGDFEVVDGGLEYTYNLPKDYVQTDEDRAYSIAHGDITPTQEDYELYDLNGDGNITYSDVTLIHNMIINNTATGLTSPAKFKINKGRYPVPSASGPTSGLYDCDGNLVETKYKLTNSFAVLTGEYSVEKNSHTVITQIALPAGFTKDNCVVVSIGLNMPSYPYRYAMFGGGVTNPTDYLGNITAIAIVGTTITLDLTNTSDTYDLSGNYKIVLMKV